MEFRHVRYFLAVADMLNFTRAAEVLHVSQPTLSHQIRQLEQELGAPLFDRIGKRVRLTAAGDAFRSYASASLKALRAGHDAIGELDNLATGTVRIGVIHSFNTVLVPTAVSKFLRLYPRVQVEADEIASPAIEDALSKGAIDFGFGLLSEQRNEGVVAEDVFEEQLSLILPADHQWANRGSISLKEASHLLFASLGLNFATRRMIDRCFEQSGTVHHVALTTTSIPSILAAVRLGNLATIQAAHFLPLEGLACVELVNPTPTRRAGLLWERHRHRTAAARALADILRSEIGHRIGRSTVPRTSDFRTSNCVR